MINIANIGTQIADRRRKIGLTQEELIERVGDHVISLSTLKRIENGKGHIDFLHIQALCSALGWNLQDLLAENAEQQASNDYSANAEDEEELQERIYRQRLFYPRPTESPYYERYPIKTLMQFIIYLPLMDELQVSDVLRRIEGDIFGRESYVLDRLRFLFSEIPESKAKHYADYAAGKCTYDYFIEYWNSDITEADKIWLNADESEEMLSCYKEYIQLLENKRNRMAKELDLGSWRNQDSLGMVYMF